MAITLLIDGYNLLYATGAVPGARGPAGLAKARQRMLGQIAAALNEDQRKGTQVVFDANRASGAGRASSSDNETVFRSMTVTYAVGYAEADDLLEEIIRKHPHPRTLTVVSGDARVQRCASARKATVVSSDQWLMQILDGPPAEDSLPEAEPSAEQERLSAEEVQKWMREFGI